MPTRPLTAEQFISRWVATKNHMFVTGEVGRFRTLSRGCDSCARLVREVRGIYQRGGYVRTQGWTLRRVSRHGVSARGEYDLVVDSAAQTYRRSRSAAERRYPGATGQIWRLQLAGSGSSWHVVNFGSVST